MDTLREDWQEYLTTISEYGDIEYSGIEKVRVERKKAAVSGGCYASGYILGITGSSRKVTSVDTVTHAVSAFGQTKIGTYKWTGGCEYEGKCYGFPRKENSLLVIDPVSKTVNTVPLNIAYRGEHHYGGVLTPEGIVYQPPRNTDHVLRIDLNNRETKMVSMPGIEVSCRYSASVFHPDGDIYLMPEFGHRAAVLRYDTEKIEYLDYISDHLVFGMVVGNDGNIYGFSKEGEGLLRLEVKTGKVEFIHKEIGIPDCYGSVVGINGRIYGCPAAGEIIWEYDIEKDHMKPVFNLEEKGYAKCAATGVCPDGTIVFLACFGEYIYFLLPDRKDINEQKVKSRYFNTFY
ncbi:MAG: hypothetical protein K6E34_08445 [Lachnospiraceae bacterium]|nr:hypothetical protein [Lachnospiraceae bacterium]